MKIVLVFPPFHLTSLYNLPPLGLLNLATVLREAGHEVSVLDLVLAIRKNILPLGGTIYHEAVKMILQENPDLVGFSVQCTTFPAVVQLSELLREQKPDLRIILGGHDVSFSDQRALEKFPWIDSVIRGEGEITFKELASAYVEGKNPAGIAGVTWRRDDKVVRNADRELISNLDDLPIPDYSFVPSLATYRDACCIPRSIAILEVGRGCPHQCVYCSESVMWRRRIRTFSVARIIGEMHHLRDNFAAECFLLAYDQFTADRHFVEEFCTRVLDEGLNSTPWYCISRLDSMDPPLLRLMREAGCESMCYGIDSGSERTLAFIRKKIDESILFQRVKETTDEGLVPTLSYIIGFPEEERDDIDKTLILALKTGVQGNNNPLLQMPTVLAGTELHRRYSDRLVREKDTYFSLGLEFDNGQRLEEDTQRIDSDPLLFSSFYNLPCAGLALDELHRLASFFPLIVNLYPKSFLLLSIALKESVSGLFDRFLTEVQLNEGLAVPNLTPAECRKHLPPFIEKTLREAKVSAWAHLPDIISYENLFLDAGIPAGNMTPATADLCRLHEQLPLRNDSCLICTFTWNVADIIADLKHGIYQDSYEKEESIIVAFQKDGGIELTEINEFGRDLLELTNGSRPFREVVEILAENYGQGMAIQDFYAECSAALAQLMEMGTIISQPECKEII
ncbi:MAG: radical SAM protein [Geobacteraceae bacterium]